jgi:hypothetical protein
MCTDYSGELLRAAGVLGVYGIEALRGAARQARSVGIRVSLVVYFEEPSA